MKSLFRRSGVIGVALIWAFTWAVPAMVLEALSNVGINFPITSLFDMWPMVLGIPGVIAGVVFTAGLWSADGRPTLETWSSARLASWGGLIGFLFGMVAFLSGVADPEYPAVWPRATAIVGLTTLLGIAAALLTALAFRHAGRRVKGEG